MGVVIFPACLAKQNGGQYSQMELQFSSFSNCKSSRLLFFPADCFQIRLREKILSFVKSSGHNSAMSINLENLLSRLEPDVSFGTVWRVKESLWQKCVSDYDQRSKREQHFGVSILRLPPTQSSASGYLPMLHGSSEESAKRTEYEEAKLDFFYARGLSQERGNEYPTFFGHLAPVKLPKEEISDIPLPDNPDEIDLDWEFNQKCIRPNAYKRRLSKNEKSHLANWLRRKTERLSGEPWI
jgi:hypothetical protein